MKDFKLFENEIRRIEDSDIRNFATYALSFVPNYFWEIGASSSGKYHPQFAQGEGGLVRHTKAVCMFLEELLRLNDYAYMKPIYKDYARVAALFHDCCKYGNEKFNKGCFSIHGELAAELIDNLWSGYFGEPAPEFLLSAICSHMGQWTVNQENRPFTQIDRLVHEADYIASRSFINIPQITEEYKAICPF